MLAREEEAVRVGIRVVVVAAVVGLLVLLLHRNASSQENDAGMQAITERALPSAAERAREVEGLLADHASQRRSDTQVLLFDTAWTAVSGLSPRRALRSVKDLIRHLEQSNRRSAAEDRALELLTAEVRAGRADAQLEELYRELLAREERERSDQWSDQAESALLRGDLRGAKRRLARARELDPESSRIMEVELAIAGNSAGVRSARDEAPDAALEPSEAWEANLAAALLLERYDVAEQNSSLRADAVFARAVASYLDGARGEALESFQALSEVGGATGALAGDWLETAFGSDGAFQPSASAPLRDTKPRQSMRARVLTGGLSLLGLDQDRPRSSLGVLGYAVSVTEHLIELPSALGRRAGKAATGYLKLRIDPARRALEADLLSWIGLEEPKPPMPTSYWEDGMFRLPRARTAYAPVHPRPVLVTRAGLKAVLDEPSQLLKERLTDKSAIVLRSVPAAAIVAGQGLPFPIARELLSALALGIEEGSLRSAGSEESSSLESLRRLDRALSDGWQITAEPWSKPQRELTRALQRSLIKGEATRVESVRIVRRKKGMAIDGNLLGDDVVCPSGHVCLERTRRVHASFYGRLDLEGELRLGAQTSFHDARFSLSVSRSGPQASLELPLSRWLGLARWITVSAYLEVGLDGIAAGPRYAPPRNPSPPSF